MEGAVLDAPDHPRAKATVPKFIPSQSSLPVESNCSTLYQPELLKHAWFTSRAYTHWTDSELSNSIQVERESLSAPPTPSLSSSGISSIQSSTHEACPTPETFTRTTRLPLRGSKANHHDFFGASGLGHMTPIDSEYEPFRTASRSNSGLQVPGRYRIADPRGRAADWAHWEPTLFQCSFCQERFLTDFDLRTHLRTHKRYRRLLKEKMRCNDLDPGSGPADGSLQALRYPSLASQKILTLDDNSTPFSSEPFYSGNNSSRNYLGIEPNAIANRTKSKGHTRSSTLSEDKDLCDHINHGPEGTTIEILSLSSSPPPAIQPSTHLRLANDSVEDQKCSLQSYTDSSEDDKDMVGRKDSLDCADSPIFAIEMDEAEENKNIEGLLMLQSSLALMKQKVIIHIMDEFKVLLKQNFASRTRTHGNVPGEASDSTYQANLRTSSQVSSTNRRRQYNGEDNNSEGQGDGEGDDDDDDQRAPKRVRASSYATNDTAKFACPYRKYDPRKYCVQNWRPCALTPLENVARVKAHLYRHHRIFQCPRCKNLFLNQNVLDEHTLAPEGCIPNRIKRVEGVTADIEKRLRSRKKAYPHQTEADRWQEIYRMLFSTVIVPSPFFEPVEESVDQISDSTKLAEFEEYTQKELPRLFWAALEEAVTKEMQPVEERLRTQLMGMIQNCQHQVFSTYQSKATLTLDTMLSDNSTRDRLLTQFESLSRTGITENQLALVHSATSSNNINAFNSSTTLSSVFRSSTTLNSDFTSSTTLSSISSSQTSPLIQPAGSDLCGEIGEEDAGALGPADETVATTDMGQTDFWTNLEDIDVSEFGMNNMWGAES